jgi:diguanylate cyclase (GGDEF)-like protein/hemerythrin-like metal-binding protein/PAS domain S-box-containing protein
MINETIEVFPWNANFATGIPQIDEQHQRLVSLLNMLASCLVYQAEISAVNIIFNELAEYAVYHFKTEEAVWHQYLTDDVWEAEHKLVHENFVTELVKLKEGENAKPDREVLEDVLSFLTHWLAFHILESDMRMSKVALAVKSGIPLHLAKSQSNLEMSGAMRVLIETVLSMYDSLSSRTLQLMKEIVSRQKAEEKLRLAANVIENTLESICITDADTNIVDVNPAFYQITLFSPEEVIGISLKSLKFGLGSDEFASKIWETVAAKGHWSGEIKSRKKNGEIYTEWLTLSVIKDEAGLVSNYAAVFSNVAYLIQQRHELERIANYDSLTGLPNRLLLADRLELAMAHAERTRSILAVCYLDLDGFKPVNDQLGHAAGDVVLQEISLRLLKIVRGNDTVARLGGDEFMILFGDLKAMGDLKELLDRVLQEITLPVQFENDTARVTGSIGVAQFPQDGHQAGMLMQNADQAMYQAKRLGKSRYSLFDSTMT